MAAGYFAAGRSSDKATFELYVRHLPANRKFLIAAGIAQAIEYLINLRFDPEELEYLRGLPVFHNAPSGFFDHLRTFRFTGDVFAVAEGTPMFAEEPFLIIRAPIIEAQIVETYLLAMIGFQSMIASKAARIVEAAQGRPVVEFGTRRAHSPEAGMLAARAAYIGGCIGTSNTECGFRYGVPVFGTAAHSWVQSFRTEAASFESLQRLLGEGTVYLIDTYDTIEGARRAASLGRPLWGVRLDSGNLAEISRDVRRILDQAGLPEAKIMASGDLNEYKIKELVSAGAPIDSFGVGTELSTSADAPSLGVVYKLVEVEDSMGVRYVMKLSHDKQTLPGAKQIFRFDDHDVLARSTECVACGTGSCRALIRPLIIGGSLVDSLPAASEAREHAAESIAKLPDSWRVEVSSELTALADNVRKGLVS